MLLADYMKLAHAVTDDGREVPVDLNQVTAFELGEKYLIRLRSGKTMDVRDFDDVLDIMRDEFNLWREQYVPEVLFKTANGPGAKFGVPSHLQIRAVSKSDFLPAIPADAAIERIRLAVTMYNLTGSWDQLNKVNL